MKRLNNFLHRDKGANLGQASSPLSSGAPRSTSPQPKSVQTSSTMQQPPLPTVPGGPTLNIALENQTHSDKVYAYITGRALDNDNALFLLLSDGQTPYLPESPSSIGTRLAKDTAIILGPPGQTVTVTIPHLAGGRIYFSVDAPLTFFLNPGPALVEPSVTNPSDLNININWGFAEFTFNNDQLYANISYVDFVGPPVALKLDTFGGNTQHVSGMPSDGLDKVCNELHAQNLRDGKGWDQLVVRDQNGHNLRALSPNQGMVFNPNLFADYFNAYIDRAWNKFSSRPMSIDTQAAFGVLSAKVDSSSVEKTICFGGSTFTKPTTRDIFSCSTGPFQTGPNAEKNCIIPRFAAAFNRSTLLATDSFPADRSLYYREDVTNHYSRIVHEVNVDGKGYAFPYDDVQPSGGPDQSGEVHAGDPKLFTVIVGGRHLKT